MVSPSLLAAATLAASASPHLQPRQASSNSTLPPGTASLNVSLGDARGDTDEKTLDCNAQQFRYYLTVPNVYVKANNSYLCRVVQRAYFDNAYGRYTTINQPYHEQLYNETQAINRTMQGDNATQFVFPLYFPGYKYHGWPDHAPGEMGLRDGFRCSRRVRDTNHASQ
ncbi:hypothetical protein FA10DRAFT_268964 [Acaromyces ingoldii]|uniref:Uncharacterized protein n=1 Tax=Acaromyces ingoldii TaxID=215250 RepID=A0A316YEX7_9BASI|nr:hypothetical protein FA10DRAFT_268964 [Acaromyces ingoldii]PWN87626.1 hypothetical protein FA10DRAFT_268964 [Acaromyces ingoldii]